MRFVLIDRILECEPGKRIVAVKNLTLAEEYLADHFPGFPVMPGVLMIEALVQTGSWLLRETENYAHSMIALKQARAIKFGSFVEPGNTLRLELELASIDPTDAEFKVKGTVADQTAVQGKIVLNRWNLADRDPDAAELDRRIVESLRDRYRTLFRAERAAAHSP